MSGLAESAAGRRIKEQCGGKPSKVALHIPTNHKYQVVLAIPGAGVELADLEGRPKYDTWANWTDPDIWREQP
jgi:hypothetical protein